MRLIIETIVILICVITAVFAVHAYWNTLLQIVYPAEAHYTIYLRDVAVSVTVANTQAERVKGLSGAKGLRPQEGKLFIFDTDAEQGIWMKDMNFPLDIIWIDKNFKIVHMAENVDPSTYPEIFYPRTDARFVLEVNAHFVSNYKIQEGDTLSLPASLIPADIRANLQ